MWRDETMRRGSGLGIATTLPAGGRRFKNMSEMIEGDIGRTKRLPLWRNVLDDMIANGVTHGSVFTSEYFEKGLMCERDSMEFGLAVSEIRLALEALGLYLSGRGQKGNQFTILNVESNADIMRCYDRASTNYMRRAVILGTATDVSKMDRLHRERHEKILEKVQTRLALLGRPIREQKAIASTEPQTNQ